MKRFVLLLLFVSVSTVNIYGQWSPFSWFGPSRGGLQLLIANPDTVIVVPWTDSIFINTIANLGSVNSSTYTDYISTGNRMHIRQGWGLPNDKLLQVQLFVSDFTKIIDCIIEIWRRNQLDSTKFTKIGSSNITSFITSNGILIIVLNPSIQNVMMGDFIGLRCKTTGNVFSTNTMWYPYSLLKADGLTNSDSSSVIFNTVKSVGYLSIVGYMLAPDGAYLGNSLSGGVPEDINYTYFQELFISNNNKLTYPYTMAYPYGISIQNNSYGGQTLNYLQANFFTLVTRTHPRWCAIENTNSLGIPASNYIIPAEAIIDSCWTHNIQPVFFDIPPKNASNTVMLTRDTIDNVLNNYRNVWWFNVDSVSGTQVDTGSPPPTIPNYWRPFHSPDGIHYLRDIQHRWGITAANLLIKQHYILTDTTKLSIIHNRVYDTSVFMPITITDSTYYFWDIPDSSGVMFHNINSNIDTWYKLTYIDSIPLTFSRRYSQNISINGNNNDSIKYTVQSYYKGKSCTTAVNKLRLGVRQLVSRGLIINWLMDSCAIVGANSTLKNLLDTLTARQNTSAQKPIGVDGVLPGHRILRFGNGGIITYMDFASKTGLSL